MENKSNISLGGATNFIHSPFLFALRKQIWGKHILSRSFPMDSHIKNPSKLRKDGKQGNKKHLGRSKYVWRGRDRVGGCEYTPLYKMVSRKPRTSQWRLLKVIFFLKYNVLREVDWML